MSERVKALTVILEQDYTDESLKVLTNAIQIMRGVMDVTLIKVGPDDYINRRRIACELKSALIELLDQQ